MEKDTFIEIESAFTVLLEIQDAKEVRPNLNRVRSTSVPTPTISLGSAVRLLPNEELPLINVLLTVTQSNMELFPIFAS